MTHFLTNTTKYRLILSAVHMVYRLVNSTYNVRELSLRLTRLLCQFIQATSASIYILDPVKKRIILIASFDNQINVLIDKKKDLSKVSQKEKTVTTGNSIFEKHLIGLPLTTDDYVGAIFIRREKSMRPFDGFDKEMLAVFSEQAVTAIRNLQLYEEQQKIILESIKCIGQFFEKQGHQGLTHTPVYVKIVTQLAERLDMAQNEIECLQYASILHDAGAAEVPFEILSKRKRLTREEFKVIRNHPTKSVELIKPVEFLKPVLPIILYHHERYDGTGYPSGLKKEQIPLGARVMAIVDAFEAMVRGRPYRKTLPVREAISELKRNSGTQFDPKVVQAFCELSQQRRFRKHLRLIKRKKSKAI